jgi:hypothetical protein
MLMFLLYLKLFLHFLLLWLLLLKIFLLLLLWLLLLHRCKIVRLSRSIERVKPIISGGAKV